MHFDERKHLVLTTSLDCMMAAEAGRLSGGEAETAYFADVDPEKLPIRVPRSVDTYIIYGLAEAAIGKQSTKMFTSGMASGALRQLGIEEPSDVYQHLY